MRETLFIIFGLFTLGSAMGVVVSRQPVYSAFSLVLSFFGLAALYILWGSNFIAMLQILIYAGAIVVLFVFVVMLLNLKKLPPLYSTSNLYVFTTVATIGVFSACILRTLTRASELVVTQQVPANGMRTISKLLFTEYLWPFEILSLFLLALIISVCILAREDSDKERRQA